MLKPSLRNTAAKKRAGAAGGDAAHRTDPSNKGAHGAYGLAAARRYQILYAGELEKKSGAEFTAAGAVRLAAALYRGAGRLSPILFEWPGIPCEEAAGRLGKIKRPPAGKNDGRIFIAEKQNAIPLWDGILY